METEPRPRAIRNAAVLVLFLLPLGYVGLLLAVAVHEFLGHGLFAVLLGGEFSGFALMPDGMGWAASRLPAGHAPGARILHLASGILATVLAGATFLAAAWVARKRRIAQLVLLLLSVLCLMDGVPYLLWNALRPVEPGDVGRMLLTWSRAGYPGAPGLRAALVAAGALTYAACTVYFCAALFSRMEAQILEGGQFRGRSRAAALLLLLVVPGAAGWFSFDWNQLAPGVGPWPCVAGAASIAATALALFWIRPRAASDPPVRPLDPRLLAASWGAALAILLPVLIWFRHGVRWR